MIGLSCRVFEVCLLTTWDGVFSLRHGSFNYGFNPAKNAAGWMPETSYVKGTCTFFTYLDE